MNQTINPLDARGIKDILGPKPIWEHFVNHYEIPARATPHGVAQWESTHHSTQAEAEACAAECHDVNYQHVALVRLWHDDTSMHSEIIKFDAEEERVRIERAEARRSREEFSDRLAYQRSVL
jgi:hypothetical protein